MGCYASVMANADRGYTAHSFVPFYSQSICSACVMHGADGILKGIRKASHSRLRAAVGCA